MKQGDFSDLAKNYIHRTGYSLPILKALYRYAELNPCSSITADVGAGTGKLTENLVELGFGGFAIEPNNAMREEGIRLLGNNPFSWLKGRGEETGLPDASVDWILMGSSFHWTESQKTFREFKRILKPGGFFGVLWNPRDLESSPFHMEIENWIYEQVPHLNRISSGSCQYTKNIGNMLLAGDYFKDLIFMEASYTVEMSRERFLGVWGSVNDIRSQAGEEKFQEILNHIIKKTAAKKSLLVPYKTRAWMVRAS